MLRINLHNNNQGFSLFEVLIALFLMALGLLALLQLQMQSIRVSQSAFIRNQAVLLSGDLFDRMRVNPDIGVLINDKDLEINATMSIDKDCIEEVCDKLEMANFEVANWANTVRERLPDGSATLSAGTPDTSAKTNTYTLSLRWKDQKSLIGSNKVGSGFSSSEFVTSTELQYEYEIN